MLRELQYNFVACGKQPCRTSHGRNPPADYRFTCLGAPACPEGEGQLENSAPGSRGPGARTKSTPGVGTGVGTGVQARVARHEGPGGCSFPGSLLSLCSPHPPFYPCTWPLETTSLPSFSKISSAQKCRTNGILRCVTFCGWLSGPGKIPWRLTHVCVFISICTLFNVKEATNTARLIDGQKRESCPGEQEASPPPVPDNTSLDSTLGTPFFLAAGNGPEEHTPHAEQQRCPLKPRHLGSQPHSRDDDVPVASGSGRLFPVSAPACLVAAGVCW